MTCGSVPQPNRELDLDHKIATLGGNRKFSTSFVSKVTFDFFGCTVKKKNSDSTYKLLYDSVKSNGSDPISFQANSGLVDVIVPPGDIEETLLDYAYSSGSPTDIRVYPIRDISPSMDGLLLTKILNPISVAAAVHKSLEDIITEVKNREDFST
jgi:hypothetical protein